jgi:hypothetical protein
MLVSSVFGAAVPMLIGDFENPVVIDRYDGWWEDGGPFVTVTTPPSAITLHTHALKCTSTVGGLWCCGAQVNISGLANGMDTVAAPESCWVVDYTAFAADFTGGWGDLGISMNCAAATGGWDKSGFQPMILDGLPHRMIFMLTATQKEKMAEGALGWGSNLGLCITTAAGNATVYFDNVRLLPAPPQDELLPHNGTIINEARIGTTLSENATLHWLAAADPNAETTGNRVNPTVVDQYVFWNDGVGGTMFYQGKTNANPGTTDPNSQYGPITWNCNKTYKWAVVDVLAGHTQTLTVGVSTLANADPNNLISPTFNWKSISTLPAITTQPVNKRAALNATNVSIFTVGVVDPITTSFQWYSSADNVIDAGDVAINSTSIPSAITNTLIIPTVAAGYQRYYYCKVYNNYTVTGGGTEPDLYTNVVALVVERMVAQYTFEGNLNDTNPVATDRHNGTGVNGATWAAGDSIEGTRALSLNGTNQYVTLGTAGYPKASVLVGGIGGGLDIGSILCWVKATQNGTVLGNADPNGATSLQLSGGGSLMSVKGSSATVGNAPNPYYIIVADGNWHLLSATWDMNGVMRLRVDTELVQVTAAPSTFQPWMYNMLIGAGRPNSSDYTAIGNYFGGLIDNLRVYNYVITPEVIAQEYFDKTGTRTCINPEFYGTVINPNFDNAGSSYCKIDLADFVVFAENWLTNGFYPL